VNKNMEETIILDGKQYKLKTDRPLTALERQQTISDIRKIDSMQIPTQTCVTLSTQAPPSIAITNIAIGEATCTLGTAESPGICDSIICSDLDCTSMVRDVVVTFENGGDLDGTITPTLTIGGVPAFDSSGIEISPTPPTVLVPFGGEPVSASFLGVALARGPNDICADFTLVEPT
jgi:hypothetical protein